jgi:hypothetical protein
MKFTTHYNYTTNLYTIYCGGKEFSPTTYTTLADAQAEARSLQSHFDRPKRWWE